MRADVHDGTRPGIFASYTSTLQTSWNILESKQLHLILLAQGANSILNRLYAEGAKHEQ